MHNYLVARGSGRIDLTGVFLIKKNLLADAEEHHQRVAAPLLAGLLAWAGLAGLFLLLK